MERERKKYQFILKRHIYFIYIRYVWSIYYTHSVVATTCSSDYSMVYTQISICGTV